MRTINGWLGESVVGVIVEIVIILVNQILQVAMLRLLLQEPLQS